MRLTSRIKRSQLPGVVVIDPAQSEYYDTTIEGAKIAFDGASIFSVLEGFYQHFLRPKRSETALEWGSRSATMTLITTGVSFLVRKELIIAMDNGPSFPRPLWIDEYRRFIRLAFTQVRRSGSEGAPLVRLWRKGRWSIRLGLGLSLSKYQRMYNCRSFYVDPFVQSHGSCLCSRSLFFTSASSPDALSTVPPTVAAGPWPS
jgi:hypothetical protein